MIDPNYEVVVGLEVHAEISTKSKMFCSCKNDPGRMPNTNVCPVCMGFPGQLPVVNKEALRKGMIAALALNCEIQKFSKFDRKNYFYPDLPKGFQISQYDQPLSKAGKIKNIRITRLHLEDDAGKLMHVPGGSLCDYNRSGVPLMEIVSEPDIRSAEEAVEYTKELQTILRYVGSSDADMERGMMRFDASVSIRKKGETKLNFRAEIKNLNSFKALASAIDYEFSRQVDLDKKGEPLEGNMTVGWDDEKQATYVMRSKEGDADYRYFPEPDLPPIIVDDKYINELKVQVPELPDQKRAKYVGMGVSEHEGELIALDIDMAKYFEAVVASTKEEPKKVASFITSIFLKHLNDENLSINKSKVKAEHLAKLFDLVKEGVISGNMAKGDIFEEMYYTGKNPDEIVNEKGLKQVSDMGAIDAVCRKVVEANPNVVAEYKSGKDKLFGFFVGQAMKELKGQGNPVVINEILKKLLS
ncbi:MAG: aspartyl/glutamyl-tRNA amidotransferase subunit B, aspartyl-tRNA(Asn)/glutamyl-tRNA (Gln) amidotransferase subunit B [Candidatus Peregrinibacteria bacterium GW2011_GWF2_38_29]|nr:MAG: aspartyl/glutamyl-tRNA amidotransferase subunit B, aspartyl-tRNA(Asn)/glutamyl-tRNA (Gln) amidotransferase subunit B [Candidatus Peregrinibacteria bacterium GW2011_GWF2_38_29]HBB02993.1 Asp-tRNA(Asn)/Glu-tRNA(Gln) amidotransferase GatCAB subunit B [Candidatus Peregrinibacteria bacterium]